MIRVAWLAVALAAVGTAARAEDCEAPCVSFDLSMELASSWMIPGSASNQTYALQPELELETIVAASDEFRLVSRTTLGQVIDPPPWRDSAFENLGLYARELYGEVDLEPLLLRAGKFAPVFSEVADVADGFNSDALAGNADMDESLGFEAQVALGEGSLQHALTLTAFTMDRSFLAGSLLTERPAPRLADGGAGNTSGLSSFSAILDGCAGAAPADCHEEGRFGYHLGLRYQRPGRQTQEQRDEGITPHGETALLAAANGNLEIAERTLRLIGEAAYVDHLEGGPDNALIVTGVAALVDGQFTCTAALARQWDFAGGAPDTTQDLLDLSVKYDSEDDSPIAGATWSIEAGYTLTMDEDDQIEHTLGLKLNLDLGHAIALK